MKFLRLLVVMLVSVTVPFTATAAVFAPMASCSSSSPHHAHATSATSTADCCALDHARSGSHHDTSKPTPCKASLDCTSCATISMAPSFVDMRAFSAPQRIVLATGTVSAPRHDPFGLWRPPRSA